MLFTSRLEPRAAKNPPRTRQEARGPLSEPDAKGIEPARGPLLEPTRAAKGLESARGPLFEPDAKGIESGSSPLGSCTTLVTRIDYDLIVSITSYGTEEDWKNLMPFPQLTSIEFLGRGSEELACLYRC